MLICAKQSEQTSRELRRASAWIRGLGKPEPGDPEHISRFQEATTYELSPGALFRDTVEFWRRWLSHCTYTGRWREMVQRSAMTLKLLSFEPTGAIVAAPTCRVASIPSVCSCNVTP